MNNIILMQILDSLENLFKQTLDYHQHLHLPRKRACRTFGQRISYTHIIE